MTNTPLQTLLAAKAGATVTVPADWTKPDDFHYTFEPGDVLTHDGGSDDIPWTAPPGTSGRIGRTWFSAEHLTRAGLTLDEPEVDFDRIEDDIRTYLGDLPPASTTLRARDITEIVRKALASEPSKPEWHDAKVIAGAESGVRRIFLRHYDGEAFITDSGTRWDLGVVASMVSDIEILVPADA